MASAYVQALDSLDSECVLNLTAPLSKNNLLSWSYQWKSTGLSHSQHHAAKLSRLQVRQAYTVHFYNLLDANM